MPTKKSVRTLEMNRVVSTPMTIFKSFFLEEREMLILLLKKQLYLGNFV